MTVGQSIGWALKTARHNKRITQTAVGIATGLNQSQISRYEVDAGPLSLDLLSKWCQCLGVNRSDIVGAGVEFAPT